jgi:hypothetical protein
MKVRTLTLLLLMLLGGFSFHLVQVSAASVEAVYGTPPTIDGTLTAGEWTDATTVTFTGPSGLCTVYVKQDGSNLYIGFHILDSTQSSNDLVEVALCKNNDHASGPITDDFLLTHFRPRWGPPGDTAEAQGLGGNWVPQTIGGWSSAASHSASSWEAEFSITFGKLGITAGIAKTLGAEFFIWDDFLTVYSWHALSANDHPNQWGDITPGEALWAPWFTDLPLILIFSTLLLLLFKKHGVLQRTTL